MKRVLMLLAVLLLHQAAGADRPQAIVFENDTVLTTDVMVEKGETMIIRPGIRVEFEGYRRFVVQGTLVAEGTARQPILFSCTGRPRAATDKPCWQGFDIVGKEANALFRHCRIEGAFRNLVSEARPVFDSCALSGNHYALYCIRNAAPHVSNSHLYRNTYGIAAEHSTPLVLENVITRNTVGVYAQLSSTVIAGRNTVKGNEVDIRSEESLGENRDVQSAKQLWDLMRQFY
jgi:hypothetical protein